MTTRSFSGSDHPRVVKPFAHLGRTDLGGVGMARVDEDVGFLGHDYGGNRKQE